MKKLTAGLIALLIVDISSVAYAQIVDGCIFRGARWSRNLLEKGPNESPEACALACSSPAGPTMIGTDSGGQAPCRGWSYIIPGALGTGMGAVCTIHTWPDQYPPVVERSLIALCSGGGSLPAKPPVTAAPPVTVAPPVIVAPAPTPVIRAPHPRVVTLPPRVHTAPPRIHVHQPRIHVHTPRVHAPRVPQPRVHVAQRPRVQPVQPRVHVKRVQRVHTNRPKR